ncbi:MAG: hypothetical protein NC905_04620 [Candidatus Omnitrophica bacterium]|nr:hypothetical protein [Candidatus Omnitrophota bacterium]
MQKARPDPFLYELCNELHGDKFPEEIVSDIIKQVLLIHLSYIWLFKRRTKNGRKDN